MTYTEQAIAIREAMDNAAAALDDSQALACVRLYKTWESLVEESYVSKDVGFRFRHNDKLYKTMQPGYTFVNTYIPGEVGTESLFAVIDETHSGTKSDPIPYDGNMELFEGKHYIQNGVVYHCTRSTGQPVYHDLASLVGIYVQEGCQCTNS